MAAGRTAIIKPAALAPLTTSLLASVMKKVGLPAGVLNVINTAAPGRIIEPLLADPRLRKLSFTGSTVVGQRLLGQAATRVLRTSMELGGNAPFVVFADADLDAAVAGALVAKFRNIGQACTAANRFLVHRSVVEEFTSRVTSAVERFTVGRCNQPDVTIGPLID